MQVHPHSDTRVRIGSSFSSPCYSGIRLSLEQHRPPGDAVLWRMDAIRPLKDYGGKKKDMCASGNIPEASLRLVIELPAFQHKPVTQYRERYSRNGHFSFLGVPRDMYRLILPQSPPSPWVENCSRRLAVLYISKHLPAGMFKVSIAAWLGRT